MQKWEYLDLPVEDRKCDGSCLPGYDDNGQLILNSIGQDGWELVSVDDGVAYFKRPLKAEAVVTKFNVNLGDEKYAPETYWKEDESP